VPAAASFLASAPVAPAAATARAAAAAGWGAAEVQAFLAGTAGLGQPTVDRFAAQDFDGLALLHLATLAQENWPWCAEQLQTKLGVGTLGELLRLRHYLLRLL
jgi:hypothetical protein